MEIYTVKQVAQKLRVSEPTVYLWVRKGAIESTTIKCKSGYGVGIREKDLYEFLRRHPKYNIYSQEDEATAKMVSKACIDRLYETLEKMIAARDTLDQDIKHLEEIIRSAES